MHDLAPTPIYVRAHHLFTSGDGVPALKWSSSNVFTLDASGKPVYDFTILDQIFDAYRDAGVRPMVELGFMPKDLATGTMPYYQPYPNTVKGSVQSPPKDYAMWGDLCYHFTAASRRTLRPGRRRHLVLRGLERARHRLLAGHARRLLQALRLLRRRRPQGPPHRQGRRPRHHRPRLLARHHLPASLLQTLRRREERRQRPTHPARLRLLPPQGQPARCVRRPRPHGHLERTQRRRQRLPLSSPPTPSTATSPSSSPRPTPRAAPPAPPNRTPPTPTATAPSTPPTPPSP